MNTTITEQRIECRHSSKLLARICAQGIKLWCAKHRREELITWDELFALQRSFQARETLVPIIVQNA